MGKEVSFRCVADRLVGNDTQGSASNSKSGPAFCRSLEWTADGTCLVCTLSNAQIQTIVIPADLLEGCEQPRDLNVYCTISSAEAVNAVTTYPGFDLRDASTTLVLSSARELPIRLSSALTSEPRASYPLVNPMTEEYITPHALRFTNSGTHFIAGSSSLISMFDLSRPGQEPLLSCPTGPKRRGADTFNPSMSMKGIVSALDIDPSSNLLAAGTFSRQVGLYDAAGQGECIGAFSVAGNEADSEIGGQGVTQVLWSVCGRYLHVVERVSDGAMVYDIRKTGQLLSWLHGRRAVTNQRLGIDLFHNKEGCQEVWAGGTDGTVRKWENVHLQEGRVGPDWEGSFHSGKA
jgi:telomerase Cajal body protein 1